MARRDHGDDDDEPRANSPADLGHVPSSARKTKDEGARSFSVVLAQVGDGDLHDELGDRLHELVGELKHQVEYFQRDAKGTLSLKLNVHARGDGSVVVTGDVAIKKPTRRRAGSTFFLTPGANLTLENPRQQKLPLREVPQGSRGVKDLPANREVR
jgi:hypothetical protein